MDSKAVKKTETDIQDGYYLDNSVVYSQEEPVYNNEIKPLEEFNSK